MNDELEEMISRGAGVVQAPGSTRPAAVPRDRVMTERVARTAGRMMPTFVNGDGRGRGQMVTGERVADTSGRRDASLRRDQIGTPIDRKEKGRPKREGDEGRAACPSKNLAIFTRQFSVMIDAGLPLVQCLEILAAGAGQALQARADPRSGRMSNRAPTWPIRCGNIPRSSMTSSPTWSPPARRAVFSTPSCSACRSTSRNRSS